ncbi:VOC family protein [Ottowia testudinis]|uniref:VOC family protein n=2 Tax=Ottowia testudinis TaxID=2816950 RepID=A0A975H7W0_9BURK|nr:VOC family protein [Ottowia testudinis]
MADSLDEGAAWCEHALGVAPGPGGEHPLFGTHNRLLAIGSPAFPLAYLEIIAINPVAKESQSTWTSDRKRWFDMDDEQLRAQVRSHGPRLIHWVARVPDLAQAAVALAVHEIDRGELLHASRATPSGLLEWQITVRPDGQRLFDGCLPTLIEWGAAHPAAAMPASGIALQSLALRHPRAAALAEASAALGLTQARIDHAPQAAIEAMLTTPRGAVTLST